MICGISYLMPVIMLSEALTSSVLWHFRLTCAVLYAIVATDDVYLLAWIASARTAVPRNDVLRMFLASDLF